MVMPPEPGAWDHFLDTFAMATDLIPLVISVLPVELFSADGCGGALPVGAQMLVMAAALMATGQRILVLFTELIPQLFELLKTCASITYKLLYICAPCAKSKCLSWLERSPELQHKSVTPNQRVHAPSPPGPAADAAVSAKALAESGLHERLKQGPPVSLDLLDSKIDEIRCRTDQNHSFSRARS
jgi:hypothetical protein